MSAQLVLGLVSVVALVALAPQIITAILHFLPDSQGLPSGVHDTLVFAVEKLNAISFIFPVDTLVTLLTFLVVFEIALFIFKLVMRIMKLIRGTS